MRKIIFTTPILLLIFISSACTNYGKEKTFNGVELYHTKNVTYAEVDSLGAYLVDSKFADGTEKTVQLAKSGDTYQFRFVGKNGIPKDSAIVKTLKFFATVLSSKVFNGEPVEVHLCDDHLKTLKVFASDGLGKEKTVDGVQLFHTKNVMDAEADSLGSFLVKSKFADGNDKTVQITKSGDVYQFRFVIKKGLDKDLAYLQNAKIFASELSKKVFNSSSVEIHLCDDDLHTLAVVAMK